MIAATALSRLLQQMSSGWAFALVALGLILSPVMVVWVSFHRRRVLLARVEKDRYQLEAAREVSMRALELQHAERMFDLRTTRQVELREQGRRDRSLEVELGFLAQLASRMTVESEKQLSLLSSAQPSSKPSAVEQRAA